MRVTKHKNIKINLKKIIKKHIMRKLKRWIVPILIGLAGGIFLFKSEMGKKLLAKVPFLNNEA